MRQHTLYIIAYFALLIIVGCQPKAKVPSQFAETKTEVDIYPDYKEVVVPPNIAPLNFICRDSAATAYVAQLRGGGQELLAAAAKNGTVQMDSTQWRALLTASKGSDISVDIYAKRPDGWVHFIPYKFSVAEEPIDAFISYRLIEPGYELYRQLGIYQRNLTTFDEVPVYENNRQYSDGENHCINCHNFRSGSTESMLFHVRANHGGTIIVQNGKAHKIQLKDSTIITSGVYPSWHPTENLVAFSTNKTGQAFHLYYPEKIEVLDEKSDLLLYDVTKNEVSHIIRTSDDLETFPCWSPDGRTLYYCTAKRNYLLDTSLPDSTYTQQLLMKFDSIRYNLMSISFDPKSRRFGRPVMEVDAVAEDKSISVPRVSPDGRYILYTKGNYGQFHIWHTSSDLWVKDIQTGDCYPLSEANSPDVDSFHSWSSNSRWFAFSSRRMDANYTRLFLAYFDKDGKAHKPFVIPQEDPEWNVLLLKSYNVPELSKDAVGISMQELRQCIYDTEAENATYKVNPSAIVDVDATSGASPKKPVDGTTGASPKKTE
ncbi:MAG: PD40 domain-containing protein [Bacteroidaceae bacterium]|nr:PD40 domain-containing protein [Bacteroidaceae bacterium]